MLELDFNGQRIKEVLKDTKHENRYANSIFSKREELQQTITIALNKKKKDLEGITKLISFNNMILGILERNNDLESDFNNNIDRNLEIKSESLIETYTELYETIKELQKREKDLVCEINNVLSDKENLNNSDKKTLEEDLSSAGKYKALSHLYANFLRLRWVEGDKLYGYVAVNGRDFKRFEVSNSPDKFERINNNWEELEKCLS